MALYIDQEYAINNDRRRERNEVGIARMCREGGDTWAMSPEMAVKLGWALIAAAQEFDVCEHGVRTGDWCEPCNRECKAAIKDA